MLYAITDRRLFGAEEAEARRLLIAQAGIWASHRVAWIQLREKDLSGRELVELARGMQGAIHAASSLGAKRTLLLINGRPDVAIAAGADGVHLPSRTEALTPEEVRAIFAAARPDVLPAISVSCHTLAEVERARAQQVDCILFAPVFEKSIPGETLRGTGLACLEAACKAAVPVPVFALGGVTAENAPQCLVAGAAGLAAIRWLHQPAKNWSEFTDDFQSA